MKGRSESWQEAEEKQSRDPLLEPLRPCPCTFLPVLGTCHLCVVPQSPEPVPLCWQTDLRLLKPLFFRMEIEEVPGDFHPAGGQP